MPYVNIKVTGGSEAPTAEQKAELIAGVTELLARVLGKNPETTVVVIDEVDMENWGIGGESVAVRRRKEPSPLHLGETRIDGGAPCGFFFAAQKRCGKRVFT